MDDLIGKRFGQYEITALLGEGGMAGVYQARQGSMRRNVALKIIKPGLIQMGDFVIRFEREAQTIAALSHPHIIKVFDYGQQDDVVYLVMELLTGGSLAELIDGKALAPAKAAQILDQVASALDYAHRRGVIHRDLKPQNVLLDEEGNAFLTDFGIAKLMQVQGPSITQTGMAMGTPAYMSPEQWLGRAVDSRADLYALGVMLFEMLTGRLPFSSETPYSLMRMHVDEPPPSILTVNPELTHSVEKVINKALSKDPADRFQSASDFASAFRIAVSGGDPIPDKPDDVPTGAIPIAAGPTKSTSPSVPTRAAPMDAPTTIVPAPRAPRSPLMGVIAAGVVVLVLVAGAIIVVPTLNKPTATPTEPAVITVVAAAPSVTLVPPTSSATTANTIATDTKTPTSTLTPSNTATNSPIPTVTLAPSATTPPATLAPTLAPTTAPTTETASGGAAATPAGGADQVTTFTGHTDSILSVAYSPDGHYVATGSSDNSALLWDATNGNHLHIYTANARINAVAFTPDSNYLVGAGDDGTVRVWQVASGGKAGEFGANKRNILALAISPDGKYVATGSNDGIARLWTIANGEKTQEFTGHTSDITGIAFSPDSKTLVTSSNDTTIRLWDVASGQSTRTITPSKFHPTSVAFAPDGNSILIGSADDNASLWNVSTGEKIRTFSGHANSVTSVAFSPDGGYILTGSTDKTAKVWDITTGQVIQTFSGHTKAITSVAFSPDGLYALTGSQDKTAKQWTSGITGDTGSTSPLNVNTAIKWTSPDGAFSTLLPPGWSVVPAGELDGPGLTSITLTNLGDARKAGPAATLTFAVGPAAALMKQVGATHTTLDGDIQALRSIHMNDTKITVDGLNILPTAQIGSLMGESLTMKYTLIANSRIYYLEQRLATLPGDRMVLVMYRAIGVIQPRAKQVFDNAAANLKAGA